VSSSKTLSAVQLTGNGYPGCSRAVEGEGSKEEEWHHASVTLLEIQVGSPAELSCTALLAA